MNKEVKCNRMLRSNHGVSGIVQPLETMWHGGTPVVRKLLDYSKLKFVLGYFVLDFVLLMAVFGFLS